MTARSTVTDQHSMFATYGTSVVSDVLDQRGVAGSLWGVGPVWTSHAVAGPAFTVQFEAVAAGEPAPAADYIDDIPEGCVVVLANSARHCTVWGDILAQVALERGIVGTVIDGYCRDADGIRELGYPVWARGAFMRSGKNRVRMTATQVPVLLGEGDETVRVDPGDIVCADGSGVVVVPRALADEVRADGERVVAMENRVLADVAAGVPLREARRRHGYNQVARRLEQGAPR